MSVTTTLKAHRTLAETRVEALFVSDLQRSDRAPAELIRSAVAAAVRRHGTRGCAALVAQEFGEHPETAVGRMRWAIAAARQAYAPAPTTPRCACQVEKWHLTPGTAR